MSSPPRLLVRQGVIARFALALYHRPRKRCIVSHSSSKFCAWALTGRSVRESPKISLHSLVCTMHHDVPRSGVVKVSDSAGRQRTRKPRGTSTTNRAVEGPSRGIFMGLVLVGMLLKTALFMHVCTVHSDVACRRLVPVSDSGGRQRTRSVGL